MHRRPFEVIAVVAFIAGIVVCAGYGHPRFWGDFTGMTEAEARTRLGQPFRDTRRDGDGDPQRYRLGWQQGLETGLFLEFENGVVVSQERIGR